MKDNSTAVKLFGDHAEKVKRIYHSAVWPQHFESARRFAMLAVRDNYPANNLYQAIDRYEAIQRAENWCNWMETLHTAEII